MKSVFRVLLALFCFLAISVSLFAGGQAEPAGSDSGAAMQQLDAIYPQTFIDDLGNEITLNSEPQSIASLTLFSDEVLMEMVGPQRLAGLTFLSEDPAYSNIADISSEVEVKLELNVEQLINIFPDLIIVADWSDPAKLQQLRDAGLTVYAISTPSTIDGIMEAILDFGAVINAEEAAQAIVADMNDRLNAVAETLETGFGNGTVQLSAIDYSSWNSSNGRESTWNAILESAGIINAVAELEADDFGQVPVSREFLVELDPDVVFLPGYVWGDPEGAEKFAAEIKDDPALAGTVAVQQDRIYLVPENLKSTYSQYIVDAVEFVAAQAYPELF